MFRRFTIQKDLSVPPIDAWNKEADVRISHIRVLYDDAAFTYCTWINQHLLSECVINPVTILFAEMVDPEINTQVRT